MQIAHIAQWSELIGAYPGETDLILQGKITPREFKIFII
jgi:hypothetical protein